VSDWFHELAAMQVSALETLLLKGSGPPPESLIDREYRGLNIVPGAHVLGIRKFIKGFHRDPGSETVEGYNIRAVQNADDAEWAAAGQGKRFGFFLVTTGARGSGRYPSSTLLDYGSSPRNSGPRLERLLRDYVVVPDPAEPDVLLGKAYLALGAAWIKVGWFVLEPLNG
jgi:hypothetical protein